MISVRFIIALCFIAAGVFFSIVSVLGIYKFKYVLNRMHSAAVGDTLAIFFVLMGLIIIEGFTFTSLKLAIIILFFWIASPVSSHLISNMIVTVDKKHVDELCEKIDFDENKTIGLENNRNEKVK